jgi:dTDP-6-deoxy-L-talose 4-dehydrogenase (NAD+)
MNILVTGAAGFVGGHVVEALLSRGHQVKAADRDEARARKMPWFERCRFVTCDIHQLRANPREIFGEAEAVIHLAWPGLPNYKALFHYEVNLPADYRFLKALVADGYSQILVTGTCFEYGMQNGCLSEKMVTRPANPYALAKDTLRKCMEMLQMEFPFRVQWARMFYLYGEGQNPQSLLAQLDQAIERGDSVFNMSGGEQLRDYLPIQQVADYLAAIIEDREFNGIVNVCSGRPISVRSFVEGHLAQKGKSMRLNLGHYPYPDYEPMAFWGDPTLLHQLTGTS